MPMLIHWRVLTGSMRLAQEAREQAASMASRREAERKARERERKRKAIEALLHSRYSICKTLLMRGQTLVRASS